MNIFWTCEGYREVIGKPLGIITTGTQDMGNGVYLLRAGTPISEDGQVSNNSNAKYVVAEDFYFYSNTPNQAKVAPVIKKGYVDKALAEEVWGDTYSEDALSALETAGVIVVDGALSTGSAAGGGSVLVVNVTESAVAGTPVYTADKTAGEMYEAMQNGMVVYHTINPLNGLVNIAYPNLYRYTEGTYTFGYPGAGGGLTASSSTDYPTGTGGK